MYETTVYSTYYRVFDSVEDLIESARAIRCDKAIAKNPTKAEWIGRTFAGWEDVYAAARSPWPEGEEIIRGMVADLESADLPKPASRRRKPRFDECNGDELDYDRLRAGRDYWRTARRASVRGPQTVTIVVDLNAQVQVRHAACAN